MDKNAIKKYAIWARNELIARIAQRALKYGISKDNIVDAYADSINGVLLSAVEKSQRQVLIAQIEAKGFEQVVEEVAYTWFNRLCAIRFMEVNGYLPSGVRVLSDEDNNFKPQILAQAINLDIEEVNMERVYELKEANKDEELYRYLLISQCNALNKILPYMFQKLEDYTELLLPDNLLREGSVIERLVSEIPQEDFDINQGGQVEIIGWLYQYYNTEPKAETFALLKKNVKITKERIPSATQLFTPDWIVRYMVENSLGRMWVEGHPNDELKANWKYYLEEAKQEAEVEAELVKIRNQYAQLDPKDIKVIDPCMGSGHILVYAFEVLMQIYTSFGYTEKEATISILANNLYGLDIDERAFQLAYFAVMMKARQYHKFIFKKEVQCNIHSIVESNCVNVEHLQYFGARLDELNKNVALTQMQGLLHQMHDAKEYGSLISVDNYDWDLLNEFVDAFETDEGKFSLFNTYEVETSNLVETQAKLRVLVEVGKVLAQKYEIVVTNPPYMGSNSMSVILSEYVKKKYVDTKSDLFACFIEKGCNLATSYGFNCMVTMQSWMFLSSFENMRLELLSNYTINNLMHMENMVMGIAFGTAVSNLRKCKLGKFKGTYNLIKLCDIKEKEPREFPIKNNKFTQVSSDNFNKIPGTPIAYWVSNAMYNVFKKGVNITNFIDTFQGIITGDNNKFLRLWFELNCNKIAFNYENISEINLNFKYWIPYNKGGEFRKWYGNQDYVVNWKNGPDDKTRGKKTFEAFYLKPYVSWSYITSSTLATRFFPKGFLWDVHGSGIFDKNKDMLFYLQSFIGSKVGINLLQIINHTISYQVENIAQLPIIISDTNSSFINDLTKENIKQSKKDWDSFETSWDFAKHPLLPCDSGILLATVYKKWQSECKERFNQLKVNEEELNRIFIEIYGLQDELSPEVEDKDVTVRKADLEREIKSLISYAVGCMFGRYSLDVEGLAYAGGEWDASKYTTFIPDDDNVIPITDDEYFEDDIVGRFINWLKVVYGEETLDENLQFIANALGGRGTAKEVIRKYFVNDFYKDHCKIYQKRPIYWLFDSGKKNGFKALIYMHRYASDTIARIRTDYVHEQQARYRTLLATLEQRLDAASTKERVAINKEIAMYKDKESELHTYEEKIHHLADQMISIDLDDGVKNNYAIFGDVLAKI